MSSLILECSTRLFVLLVGGKWIESVGSCIPEEIGELKDVRADFHVGVNGVCTYEFAVSPTRALAFGGRFEIRHVRIVEVLTLSVECFARCSSGGIKVWGASRKYSRFQGW